MGLSLGRARFRYLQKDAGCSRLSRLYYIGESTVQPMCRLRVHNSVHLLEWCSYKVDRSCDTA